VTANEHRLIDLLFKHSFTCYALLDKAFNYIRVNDAYANTLGKPIGFLSGKNHFEFVAKDSEAIFHKVLAEKTPYRAKGYPVEFLSEHHNGATYWDWLIEPVLDSQNEVDYFVLIMRDITTQRDALQDREKYFTLSSHMMCKASNSGYFLELSPGWSKTLGFTDEELKAQPYLSFVHPDDRGLTVEQAADLANGSGACINFVNRYRNSDDRYVWLHWNAVADAESDCVYAVAQDITFLKEAEVELERHRDSLEELVKERSQALKNSERRMLDLLSNSPAVIYTCNAHGDFAATFVSENVWDQFGYRPTQFTDDPLFWMSNIHPDDKDALLANLGALFEHGKHTHEYRFKAANGGYIWVHDQLRLIRDSEGNPIEIIGYWADITSRKKVEQELESAKVLAEEGNRSKSEFLSRMSHELRTPMNAILGFSQVLMMTAKNEDDLQSINEIVKAGNHLLELINDVLDLSKIESGRMPISMENLSLNQVIEDCFTLISPLAHKREISIVDNISSNAPFIIWADYTRFKQVMINLLSNAVKYNKVGGRVTLDVKPLPDNEIRILISDTGHGVEIDLQDKLFISFERLGAESSDVEGSGIGLVISKQLIEIMGGNIGYISEPGVGSTFWVDIHLGDVLSQNNRTTTLLKNLTIDDTEVDVDCKTILYVEDNPANLRLVNKILSGTPHKLISAHSGSLGLEMAELYKPDLILLDINLPQLNGYEVIKRIKANENLKHTPVVAISANAMNRDVERGLAAGFDRYLKKPINIREFMSTIESLV